MGYVELDGGTPRYFITQSASAIGLVAILTVINLILRLVTKEELTW